MFHPQNETQPVYDEARRDITDPTGMPAMPGVAGLYDLEPLAAAGHIPNLFDMLWTAYTRHLKLKLDERRASGHKVVSLEDALKNAPASHFLQFCTNYLTEHRPVQQFPADANLGFMLSNNVRALLCPAVSYGYAGQGGQMQDSHDVGVTRGHSQPGLNGVVNDGSIPII